MDGEEKKVQLPQLFFLVSPDSLHGNIHLNGTESNQHSWSHTYGSNRSGVQRLGVNRDSAGSLVLKSCWPPAFSTGAARRGVCCSYTHLNRSVSFPAFVWEWYHISWGERGKTMQTRFPLDTAGGVEESRNDIPRAGEDLEWTGLTLSWWWSASLGVLLGRHKIHSTLFQCEDCQLGSHYKKRPLI